MTTSSHPLTENTPILAVDSYGETLEDIAETHAASLKDVLPDDAEVKLLRERRAAMTTANAAWKGARRARIAARLSRDQLFKDGRTAYSNVLTRVRLLRKNTRGAEALDSVLSGSPNPSDLPTAADLADAMGALADSVALYPAFLSRLGFTAASLAAFRAQREELDKADLAFITADAARAGASATRTQARRDLLAQVRLLEGCLRMSPRDDVRAAVTTARTTCLPRHASRDPDDVEEEQEAAAEGQSPAADEPAPAEDPADPAAG